MPHAKNGRGIFKPLDCYEGVTHSSNSYFLYEFFDRSEIFMSEAEMSEHPQLVEET